MHISISIQTNIYVMKKVKEKITATLLNTVREKKHYKSIFLLCLKYTTDNLHTHFTSFKWSLISHEHPFMPEFSKPQNTLHKKFLYYTTKHVNGRQNWKDMAITSYSNLLYYRATQSCHLQLHWHTRLKWGFRLYFCWRFHIPHAQ